MRKFLFCSLVSLLSYCTFAQPSLLPKRTLSPTINSFVSTPTANLVISWDASTLTDVEDFSVYSSTDLGSWSHYVSTTTTNAVYPIPQGENKRFFYVKANKLTPATNSVSLSWLPPDDIAVGGYRIYYGDSSRNYTNSVLVLGGFTTTTTVGGLRGNTTYYFSITSVNLIDSLESDYDGEVVYLTPRTTTQHNVPTKIQKQ